MIQVVCSKPSNHRLIPNGECIRLTALDGGRPVLTVTTGIDRRFTRLTGQRQGWFSKFEGEDCPQAAKALFSEVFAFQRALGNERLVGPDAPDARFFPGLPVEGRGAAAHLDALLQKNGFEVLRRTRSFFIPREGVLKFAPAAARAQARYGAAVERARFSRRTCREIYGLYGENRLSFDEFSKMLRSMRPFSLWIVKLKGACAGYALVRREGRAQRVETLMIAPEFQRGPALLCLLGAMGTSLERGDIVTGAIDEANARSLAVIRALGGALRARWHEYIRYLI
jgi:hypothetical protein